MIFLYVLSFYCSISISFTITYTIFIWLLHSSFSNDQYSKESGTGLRRVAGINFMICVHIGFPSSLVLLNLRRSFLMYNVNNQNNNVVIEFSLQSACLLHSIT